MYSRWWSLLNDNPNDVSVTTLAAAVSRRQPKTDRKFHNSLKMTGPAIISANTTSDVAIVTENSSRALLILQNTSVATVAGDVPPTMYFGFSISTPIGQGLALPPGVGLELDVRVPSDAIYVTIGPSINTGNSVVISGIVQEGGVTNPQLDTVNISETGQLAALTEQLKALIELLTPKS